MIYYNGRGVSKLVFSPSPGRHDFLAPAICDADRLACVTAGDREWTFLNPVQVKDKEHLVDLVYHEEGRVYCLTQCGDMHVLRLSERNRRRGEPDPSALPAMVEPLLSSSNLPFDPASSFVTPYDTVSGYTSANQALGFKLFRLGIGKQVQLYRQDSYTRSQEMWCLGSGENLKMLFMYELKRKLVVVD